MQLIVHHGLNRSCSLSCPMGSFMASPCHLDQGIPHILVSPKSINPFWKKNVMVVLILENEKKKKFEKKIYA